MERCEGGSRHAKPDQAWTKMLPTNRCYKGLLSKSDREKNVGAFKQM